MLAGGCESIGIELQMKRDTPGEQPLRTGDNGLAKDGAVPAGLCLGAAHVIAGGWNLVVVPSHQHRGRDRLDMLVPHRKMGKHRLTEEDKLVTAAPQEAIIDHR